MIQLQNPAFGNIGCLEVLAIHVSKNGLRHPPNQNVLTKVIHDLPVKCCAKGLLCFKTMPNQWICGLVSHCPEKFLKIQRKHLDVILFRRNNDILDILFQPNQRSCLEVIKPAIRYKIFDELACSRVLLNFIKNDQRFPSVKRRCIEGCEFCEEKIKIIAIVDE